MDWDRILHLNKLPSHPKLLIIGGPPRCGKSTLAHEIMLTYGIDAVSGDAIRRVLASTGMSFLPIDPDTWATDTSGFLCKLVETGIQKLLVLVRYMPNKCFLIARAS